MPKMVGVFAKRDSPEILKVAQEVCRLIEKHGLSVVPEETLAENAKMPNGSKLSQLQADLLVTLGGDGTVLKAVHEMGKSKIPILAVNMGRRGYLTEVTPDDFNNALELWMKGDYQLEHQWKVSVKEGNTVIGEGLNEAELMPIPAGKMLSLEVTVDDTRLVSMRADGIIVATPTGSTAHALSAGGPVMESSVEDLALVFVAPLQSVRSIVVPTKKRIQVSIGRSGPVANLVIDGRLEREVQPGHSLFFGKSDHNAVFVRFGETFLQRSLRRLAFERETA